MEKKLFKMRIDKEASLKKRDINWTITNKIKPKVKSTLYDALHGGEST